MAYDEMGNYSGYDEPVSAPVAPTDQAPNSYDPFGNPIYSETEEERRKRQEEERKRQEKEAKRADESVAHEQRVVTYENGSKTVETKQEIPAGQRVAGQVRPGQESAMNRAPMDANQAYTAQMESGGKQNIGYHNPGKGTAYGTYGITAPAYADIQKANPKFAGRPITSLTPDEQGEAYQTLTGVNQNQLSRLGVAPTPENQRLAHFLGASGAAKYLQTGQVSPQAAQANGGLEKALQIAQQRLAGTLGPGYGQRAMAALGRGLSSVIPSAQAGEVPRQEAGAGRGNYQGQPQAQPGEGVQVATGYGVQGTPGPVNPEQVQQQEPQNEQRQQEQPQSQEAPNKYSLATGRGEPGLRGSGAPTGATGEGGNTPAQQGILAYQESQDNVSALMKIGSSDDANVPDFIKDRARNRAADLIQDQRETKKAQELIKTMDPTEMAKYLSSKKTDETSTRVKGFLYAIFGNKEMAQRELDKLPGNAKDTYVTGPDGKTPYLLQQNSRGEYTGGYNAETGAKLSDKELAQAATGATTGKWQTTAEFFNDKAGNLYQTQHNDKGQTRVVNVKTNERYTGEEPLTARRTTDAQQAAQTKQEYRRENDTTQFANSIRKLDYGSKLKAVEEAQQAAINRGEPAFSDSELSAMGVNRPDIGPAQARQQGGAQQGGGKLQPVNPNAAPAQAQAQGGGNAPAQAAVNAPAAPVQRETVEAGKRREAEEKTQRDVEATVAKEEGKKIADMRIALPKTERASAATLKVIDDVLSHPGFTDVIGIPNILTGIISPPGTDARDFKQKYEQLKGKTFMEAYNGLRGTGSISEAEGLRAETAIAALNDPYISEKEFKRNAEIFKTALRNGVDNERMQVGQEPRYKKFDAKEKEAFQWLQKNPKDPRADAVRLKLERNGN